MSKRPYILKVCLLGFFLFGILAGISISGTGKIICDFCKREIISGKYIEVNGKYYHPDHFYCDKCGAPLASKKYILVDGKHYCQKCYDSNYAAKCAYCGELIRGEYVEYEGKAYHKNCYNNHVALKCSLCGGIIEGRYIHDYWGNVYHQHHQGNNSQCMYCGRFISDKVSQGGNVYPDGRRVCGICQRNAVNDINTARKLLENVVIRLGQFGIHINHNKIKFSLVGKDRLNELTHDSLGNHAGLTNYEGKSVSGRLVSKKYDIYILYGMPRSAFLATAAHELRHVWQYENASMEIDPALCEGSCNYASFLILQDERDDLADYILDNMEHDPDIFYGDGYRRVKKFAGRLGVEYWLRHLKSNKNFPFGY